jgi:hypothetical protein
LLDRLHGRSSGSRSELEKLWSQSENAQPKRRTIAAEALRYAGAGFEGGSLFKAQAVVLF